MARRLLSQLGHVEIITPRLEESTRFMIDLMGLEESVRDGDSVYLRGWGEWLHHSVVLTAGDEPAIGHIGWRTEGPEELDLAVERLEASGLGEGWVGPTIGHGRAYRFRNPAGHLEEVYWEAERWHAPPELRSTFPNRPQARSARGVAARQLDHVTVLAADVLELANWKCETLGHRFMEWTEAEEVELPVFALVSTNEKVHDMGIVIDAEGGRGRAHHVAFWLDEPAEVHRAAEVLMEAGVTIEYGPSRHGMGENTFLYFREPGGARIEVFSGGYRNYVADWEPIKWKPSEGSSDMYRNNPMPDSMLEAFPAGSGERGNVGNPWALEGVN